MQRHLPAASALDFLNRAGHHPQRDHIFFEVRPPLEKRFHQPHGGLGGLPGGLFVVRFEEQARDQRIWRIKRAAAAAHLLFKKSAVILSARGLHGVVFRIVSLQKDLAGRIRAARAAGHLGEQLESAFRRAVIRQFQHGVRRDDADHRHIWKVQPFGDHLCADEDARFTPAETLDQRRMRVLGSGRVVIHA